MSDILKRLRGQFSNRPTRDECASEIERLSNHNSLLLATNYDLRKERDRMTDELAEAHRKMDELLAHCPEGECEICGTIICKYKDPMHFHHDGCPSCWKDEATPDQPSVAQEGQMEKHFVTFYSPGTFMAETTTKPIEAWDVEQARKMAGGVRERYGATPYGFQFSTRSRGPDDLDSKVVATSPMYYVNCKVETLAEIEARNDPKESILRSNMRGNGWDRIVTTTKGYKWTQPLKPTDVAL